MRWHVIAVVLAILAILGMPGALPRARAMWRRWLSDLRAWLDDVKNDHQRAARWKHTIRAIGFLAVAVLLLSLLLPRSRVIAILLAVFAVVAMLGVFPRLRAAWRRWLVGLFVVLALISVFAAVRPFPPFGASGLAPVWSRPMLGSVSELAASDSHGHSAPLYTYTHRRAGRPHILDEGTEVHVPPHLSPQLAAAVRLGDSVTVRGYRTWFEPVVRAVSITDAATGGIVIDDGPPPRGFGSLRASTAAMQPMSVEGRFDRWLHEPGGDVNGAMLADGTILRFSPSLAYRLEGVLEPGQAIRANGWGTATAYGTVVVVQTFGTGADSPATPAQPSGKGTITPAPPS